MAKYCNCQRHSSWCSATDAWPNFRKDLWGGLYSKSIWQSWWNPGNSLTGVCHRHMVWSRSMFWQDPFIWLEHHTGSCCSTLNTRSRWQPCIGCTFRYHHRDLFFPSLAASRAGPFFLRSDRCSSPGGCWAEHSATDVPGSGFTLEMYNPCCLSMVLCSVGVPSLWGNHLDGKSWGQQYLCILVSVLVCGA